MAPTIVNAMTVDVEDYFQVSAFEDTVTPEDWKSFPQRVESNVDWILNTFDTHGVKATFFTLGWIAERYPSMVKRIVSAGHELASHGWSHVRVVNQCPKSFRDDVNRTKQVLEDLSAGPVYGYRAASYSINESNLWAHDVLADAGYTYSSSIAPIKRDLYGIPDAPRFRYSVSDGRLAEIPITTIPIAGRNLNCGGGGWFRLFPYSFSRWSLNRVNEAEKQPGLFYFHPWEIDPDQPRVDGISRKAKFRHYLNLDQMQHRLCKLLVDFKWSRMDEVFFSQAERNSWL